MLLFVFTMRSYLFTPDSTRNHVLAEVRWGAPVSDFMSDMLIAARPETSLSVVRRIFEEHDISAVPMVDMAGALRGILSTTDLLRAARRDLSAPEKRIALEQRWASDLMTTDVVTIEPSLSIAVAASGLLKHRIHRLVVVDEGRPCGVFSAIDALRAIIAEKVKTPVGDVMTRRVHTIDADTPADEAVQRLDDLGVRGLVVVDGSRPVGVFTHTEALRAWSLPLEMRRIPVEQLMSYETLCLDIATPVDRVASYARRMRVRRILVVERQHLCGIVTGTDILGVKEARA
jgi:CBS domain-containing protein